MQEISNNATRKRHRKGVSLKESKETQYPNQTSNIALNPASTPLNQRPLASNSEALSPSPLFLFASLASSIALLFLSSSGPNSAARALTSFLLVGSSECISSSWRSSSANSDSRVERRVVVAGRERFCSGSEDCGDCDARRVVMWDSSARIEEGREVSWVVWRWMISWAIG